MMNIFANIAEQRIREAQEKGEFDLLPGSGKPVVLEDESHIPEDLRMAYKVLRNAGFVPPEVAERKEIDSLLDALERGSDERRKTQQMRKLEALVFRMRLRHRSVTLEANDEYYAKVVKRMSVL
ncbi:MAG: DUF1992 domain-containing protein [Desulfovibrionaceae bacterium]